MGANIKIRTTGDCAKHGLDIGVECCACGRFVVFSTDAWTAKFGGKLEMMASPLKCANCGSRVSRVRPWHQTNRPAELPKRRTPMVPLYVAKPGRRWAK